MENKNNVQIFYKTFQKLLIQFEYLVRKTIL